jgi:hypothetical protein
MTTERIAEWRAATTPSATFNPHTLKSGLVECLVDIERLQKRVTELEQQREDAADEAFERDLNT